MSLLRKGIFIGSGAVFRLGLGVLASMMLSRALLPEGMGRYQLPMAVSTFLVTLLGMGIGQANIFSLNKHKIAIKQIVTNSIWIGIVGGIALIVILPIGLTKFEGYFGVFPFWTKMSFSFGVCCLYCVNLFRPILIAEFKVRQAVAIDVIYNALILVSVAVCFIYDILTVNVALFLVALGYTGSLLMAIWFLRSELNFAYPFNFKVFRDEIAYGSKLLLANIVNVVNVSIGLILLRYLMPDDFADIGYYGRATSICALIMLMPVTMGPLLYAKWSGLSGEKRRRQAALAMRLYLAVGIIVALGVAVFARWLVLLLYGREFLPAVSPLRILVIGIAFRGIFGVCTNLLSSDGRAHVVAYILSLSVATTVALTCVLVPYYGINGAALAFMVASGLVFVLGVLMLKYSYGIQMRMMFLFKKDDFVYIWNAISKRKKQKEDS